MKSLCQQCQKAYSPNDVHEICNILALGKFLKLAACRSINGGSISEHSGTSNVRRDPSKSFGLFLRN